MKVLVNRETFRRLDPLANGGAGCCPSTYSERGKQVEIEVSDHAVEHLRKIFGPDADFDFIINAAIDAMQEKQQLH